MDLRDRTTTPGATDEEQITDEDLLTFRLMHRGMRTDSAALVDALLRLPPGDLGAADHLQAWFAALADLIEHHHTVEDEVFWPALRAVDPSFEADEAALVADHEELDRTMRAVTDALEVLATSGAGARDKADAVTAARAFSRTIHEHLDREEATALAAVPGSIRRRDWLALEERARATADRRSMTFIGPWLDDHATPEETAQLLALVPWPVGLLVRGPWRRRYRKRSLLVRRARGHVAPGDRRGLPVGSVATMALLLVAAPRWPGSRPVGAARTPLVPARLPGTST